MTPQPGDLLWTRSPGLVGWLIRFGERSRRDGWPRTLAWLAQWVAHTAPTPGPGDPDFGNHIAVVVDGSLIEAAGAGLIRSPLSKYPPSQYVLLPLAHVRPDTTVRDRAALVAFAERELAAKAAYGWLDIVSIIIQLLTPLRVDFNIGGAMICSAFGARCWEHAGVIIPTLNPYTTMPSDLAALALTPPTVRKAA